MCYTTTVPRSFLKKLHKIQIETEIFLWYSICGFFCLKFVIVSIWLTDSNAWNPSTIFKVVSNRSHCNTKLTFTILLRKCYFWNYRLSIMVGLLKFWLNCSKFVYEQNVNSNSNFVPIAMGTVYIKLLGFDLPLFTTVQSTVLGILQFIETLISLKWALEPKFKLIKFERF